MNRIAVLYICTGRYDVFWKDFFISSEEYFLKDYEKHYFVFTDTSELFGEKENNRIHKVYQENLGWPYNTLKRFNIFNKIKDRLQEFDYLFFMNANLQFIEEIGEEFLPIQEQLLVVKHPGYYNKNRNEFPYERNNTSLACVPNNEGEFYVQGALNGGKAQAFLELIEILDKHTEIDLVRGIVALWHDESHLNSYIVGRTDVKVLAPSYLYPEGWELPFNPKILSRDKGKWGGHTNLRGKKQIVNLWDKGMKKLVTQIKGCYYRTMTKKYYSSTDQLLNNLTYGTANLNNKYVDIVTIAFNNPEVIYYQFKLLNKNLKDNFYYTVADNSNDSLKRKEIMQLCKKYNITYIGLPDNPYRKQLSSLSHGAALNWTFKNYITHRKCDYFGFIDHDIFPIIPTTIIDKLEKSSLWGYIETRMGIWYLWPGLSFFKMDLLKDKKINFMPKYGGDTGAGNYKSLYSQLEFMYDDQPDNHYSNFRAGNDKQSDVVQYIGDWMHSFNASEWKAITDSQEKNKKIFELLDKYLKE